VPRVGAATQRCNLLCLTIGAAIAGARIKLMRCLDIGQSQEVDENRVSTPGQQQRSPFRRPITDPFQVLYAAKHPEGRTIQRPDRGRLGRYVLTHDSTTLVCFT